MPGRGSVHAQTHSRPSKLMGPLLMTLYFVLVEQGSCPTGIGIRRESIRRPAPAAGTAMICAAPSPLYLVTSASPPHIVSIVLGHAHTAEGAIAIYARSRYEREHREALEALANHIDRMVTGSEDNIIRLAG
jgi:hypothetical protein